MRAVCGAMVAVLLMAAGVQAQEGTALATVGYDVQRIDALRVDEPDFGGLTAGTVTGMRQTGMYEMTTNGMGVSIVARLLEPLPAGWTVRVTLEAPAGAASAGPVTLDAQTRALVTGVTPVAVSGLRVAYELVAGTPVAGAVVPVPRVAFAIADD